MARLISPGVEVKVIDARKHPKIIGIVGFISSGKDTIASSIIENYGYEKDSFAKPLKDACATIFNWPRHLLEGDTEESRTWREKEDEFWAQKIPNIKPFTPRKVLQIMGTEVLRDNFYQNLWVDSLEKRLLDTTNNIVITDCRFPNEIKLIEKYNGVILRVRRGPEPKWFNIGVKAMIGDVCSELMLRQMNIHPSEYSWVHINPHYIIENDETLENLDRKTKNLMNKFN